MDSEEGRDFIKSRQDLIKKKHNTIYRAGDKPGNGRYKCIHCPRTIFLDDETDTLPPCPKCSRKEWVCK